MFSRVVASSTRLAIVLALLGAGCTSRAGVEQTAHATAAAAQPAPQVAALPKHEIAPPERGEMIRIEAGAMLAGSKPGTLGRDPKTEANLVSVNLSSFEIDRLPYPNDPNLPPKTGISLNDAAALCEADGKRLCTDLEWERACEGPTEQTFPTGESIDLESCALNETSCMSREGASTMGTTLSEWTLPDATLQKRDRAFVHGAGPLADTPMHRCAARRVVRSVASTETGFRCCRGTAETASYPAVSQTPVGLVQKHVELDELRRILRDVPEVARFADSFRLLAGKELDEPLSRGNRSRGLLGGWTLVDEVGIWSPVAGEEIWVVSGMVGTDALLIVLYPISGGGFLHASSMLVKEPLPIAVAFNESTPNELLWSTCWGCGGEGGAISKKPDGTLALEPR